MMKHLLMLILITMHSGTLGCRAAHEQETIDESVVRIQAVCSEYKQAVEGYRGDGLADFDTASKAMAAHGLVVIPVLKQQVAESPSECVRELMVKTAGILMREYPDSAATQRLAEFLLQQLGGSLGTADLIPASFGAVLNLKKNLVPILIGCLRSESIATRSCSQELLVHISGREDLEFEIDIDSSGLGAGSMGWSEWWRKEADSLLWDDIGAKLVPATQVLPRR